MAIVNHFPGGGGGGDTAYYKIINCGSESAKYTSGSTTYYGCGDITISDIADNSIYVKVQGSLRTSPSGTLSAGTTITGKAFVYLEVLKGTTVTITPDTGAPWSEVSVSVQKGDKIYFYSYETRNLKTASTSTITRYIQIKRDSTTLYSDTSPGASTTSGTLTFS